MSGHVTTDAQRALYGVLLAAADGEQDAICGLLRTSQPEVVHAIVGALAAEVVATFPTDHDHRDCIRDAAFELAEQGVSDA